ncbi:MAG TPA: nucleotidyltransferase domain-containing protein [Candidatus Nanoarchaeia archaeon]|nr:nucleotidyltransferase domain-containing protein [Candidatus Nanoarchaeia archaeon]
MFLLNNFQIVKELAKDISKPRYASELAKLLKLNQKSVSNALHDLEKEGLLKSKFQGKNKLFFFNWAAKERIKAALALIEAEKRRLLLSDMKFYIIISELNEAIDGQYLVFGSYAKGYASEKSDLDILVVGAFNNNVVEKIERIYRIEINIQKFSEKDFKISGKTGNILIKEVMLGHVVIRGIDFFVDAFTSWNQPSGA